MKKLSKLLLLSFFGLSAVSCESSTISNFLSDNSSNVESSQSISSTDTTSSSLTDSEKKSIFLNALKRDIQQIIIYMKLLDIITMVKVMKNLFKQQH